ncbi:hypothetical protein THAOC_06769 [Thalassiosira oceanica]|uniref:MORN repeat-containing protein 5 n=1 Tax=Thalassiosira oceanica TaxID=159749 RepID=K0T1X4_THAOC|nr:hypothetical protein THAOC_06769 [Thalassiosira oceanica]|eukprot:EJK71760.1 hypothetical protein THAOC_06769 [Thalassiosira oceanica]
MDGHPPQQSSDDTPPPDCLDEDAPAATDASSTARTAPRRARKAPAVPVAAKASGTLPMTVLTVMRFVPERATFNDVGHVRQEPPRQRQKVQWSYVDGSTYVGEALDGKRDGQGTLIHHGGVWNGVFKNGKFDEGTATNVKWGDDCRYTGMAKNMKVAFLKDGYTYTGQMAGGDLNGTGTVTSADGDVYEGVFVDGFLNGRGKITHYDGGELKGTFAFMQERPKMSSV